MYYVSNFYKINSIRYFSNLFLIQIIILIFIFIIIHFLLFLLRIKNKKIKIIFSRD